MQRLESCIGDLRSRLDWLTTRSRRAFGTIYIPTVTCVWSTFSPSLLFFMVPVFLLQLSFSPMLRQEIIWMFYFLRDLPSICSVERRHWFIRVHLICWLTMLWKVCVILHLGEVSVSAEPAFKKALVMLLSEQFANLRSVNIIRFVHWVHILLIRIPTWL